MSDGKKRDKSPKREKSPKRNKSPKREKSPKRGKSPKRDKSPGKDKGKCKTDCKCLEQCEIKFQHLNCEIEQLKESIRQLQLSQCRCRCGTDCGAGGGGSGGGIGWKPPVIGGGGCSCNWGGAIGGGAVGGGGGGGCISCGCPGCGNCCGGGSRKGNWVTASNGHVPPGAIVSGMDPNKPYYVARATMDANSLVPCKLTPSHNTCLVPWNHTEIRMDQYEVLIDADCKWVKHNAATPLPRTAVLGGHMIGAHGRRELLYIGRAQIGALLVPGYVFAESRELLHSTSYTNERKTFYELLVYTC